MSGLDVAQSMTALFGGTVLIMLFLAYNNHPDTTPGAGGVPNYAKAAVRIYTIVQNALPFLFVAYTVLVAEYAKGKSGEMYRNFVLFIGLGSIIHAWAVEPKAGGTKGWGQVVTQLTAPLSQGAFFALPIALYAM